MATGFDTTDFSPSLLDNVTKWFNSVGVTCQDQLNNMIGNVYEFCGGFDKYFFIIALILLIGNLLFYWFQRYEFYDEFFKNSPNEMLAFNIGMSFIILMYLLLLKGVIV